MPTMRIFGILLLCTFVAVGCTPRAQTPPPAVCPSTPNAQQANDVLGALDGIPIKRSQLSTERQNEIKVEENESLQRRFTSLYLGVDDIVSEMLMKREAERRGVAVEALYEQEIVAKVTEPTDEEVREVYEANHDQIPVPLEQAAPYIRRQMSVQRATESLRAFIDQAKAKVDLRYSIPVPELPRFDVDGGDNPTSGPNDAKVTIIEFSDFECPYCSRANKLLMRIKELYPDKIRLVFRDFPLSQHAKARGAAAAAYCANEQGKFWAYHDLLFANAPAIAEADLKKAAETVGLELKAFDTCLSSDRPEKAIKSDEEAARKLALDGTPGLFVNGMKLVGVLPLPLMQALVDKELSR
jgi:protein-disulfide isomerase